MKKVEEMVQNVKSKEDFIKFISALVFDFRNNKDSWENKSLESYLEAVESWVEDMDGFYLNNNLPVPENINWRVFTDILIAAKMYE